MEPREYRGLVACRAHKKPKGTTELTGRLGSWSGSDATETGALVEGRRGPALQKGAVSILSGEHLRDWMTPRDCWKISDIGERFRV